MSTIRLERSSKHLGINSKLNVFTFWMETTSALLSAAKVLNVRYWTSVTSYYGTRFRFRWRNFRWTSGFSFLWTGIWERQQRATGVLEVWVSWESSVTCFKCFLLKMTTLIPRRVCTVNMKLSPAASFSPDFKEAPIDWMLSASIRSLTAV